MRVGGGGPAAPNATEGLVFTMFLAVREDVDRFQRDKVRIQKRNVRQRICFAGHNH